MEEYGKRLRARARELGLTDADVARRLGLAQSRYANYINGNREPDFATFVRICRALDTSPNEILGFSSREISTIEIERGRARAVLHSLEQPSLGLAIILLEAIATKQRDIEALATSQPPDQK